MGCDSRHHILRNETSRSMFGSLVCHVVPAFPFVPDAMACIPLFMLFFSMPSVADAGWNFPRFDDLVNIRVSLTGVNDHVKTLRIKIAQCSHPGHLAQWASTLPAEQLLSYHFTTRTVASIWNCTFAYRKYGMLLKEQNLLSSCLGYTTVRKLTVSRFPTDDHSFSSKARCLHEQYMQPASPHKINLVAPCFNWNWRVHSLTLISIGAKFLCCKQWLMHSWLKLQRQFLAPFLVCTGSLWPSRSFSGALTITLARGSCL